MLDTHPTRFHRWLLARYFSRRLRRQFACVLARDLDRLGPWNQAHAPEPLILAANHSSWWDAALPIVISCGIMRHDAYGMMEERQLARYGFFRKTGMFSINRENARSALASLAYAADLLRNTGRVLWMFPQGKIVPNDARPIVCESGIGRLIGSIGNCSVAPVAFRYELGREELPTAFISVGQIQRFTATNSSSPAERTAQIAALLTQETDSLRDAVLTEHLTSFSTLLSGRPSISTRWDRARAIFDFRF